MAKKGPRWKRTWHPLLLGTGLVLTQGALLLSDESNDSLTWLYVTLLVLGFAHLVDGLIQWKRYGWNARAEPDRSSIWNL